MTVLWTGLKGVHCPPWRVVVALVAAAGMALSAAGCEPLSIGEPDATRTPAEATRPSVKVEADATRPPVEGGQARAPVEASRTGTICEPHVDRPDWLFRDFVQWTPDGSTVLFTDDSHIYAVAADGLRLWNVVAPKPPEGKRGWPMAPFTISPDGEHVVYATCDYGGSYELARVHLDGTGVQRLTRGPRRFDSHPSWSPDGARIAFLVADFDVDGSTGDYPSGIRPRLYTMAPDGTHLMELPVGTVDRDTHLHYHRPQWSPDGRRLAFAKQESWVVTVLYTFAVDGDAPQRLTEAVSAPSWSPDGERLAFAKPDGAEVALYTIAADGSDAQRVTVITGWHPEYGEPDPTRAWIDTVAWSPDGSKILYSCGGICVVDLNDAPAREAPSSEGASSAEDDVHRSELGGQALRRVAADPAAWSPDGSRIASLGDGVVYTVAPDGSDVRVLARQGEEGRPHSAADARQAEIVACAAGMAVPEPAANPDLVKDCETLLRVRDALRGTAELNWSANRPIGEWDGLYVAGWPRRLIAISLNVRGLTGKIPPELGELIHLRRLELRGNALGGAIPPELGRLTQLARLALSKNSLIGGIPPELSAMTRLVELRLDSNNLEGPIPPALGRLVRLTSLRLDGNQLTGPIPPDLGLLVNLKHLYLSDNHLTGAISAELGQLGRLEMLDLSRNQLTGPIPPDLGQLANLKHLFLSDNRLTGAIPPELGQLSLWQLFLGENQLDGCMLPKLLKVQDHDLASLGLPDCEPA